MEKEWVKWGHGGEQLILVIFLGLIYLPWVNSADLLFSWHRSKLTWVDHVDPLELQGQQNKCFLTPRRPQWIRP